MWSGRSTITAPQYTASTGYRPSHLSSHFFLGLFVFIFSKLTITISPSQNNVLSSLRVLVLSLQRYCEIQARALSCVNIRLKRLAIESARKNSFFTCTDSISGQGLVGSIPRQGLKPQFAKNGEMPVLLLTWLFIVNSASGRQLTQLSYIKLIKAQRYLFTAALIILVQPSIFRCQAELSLKVVLRRLLSRRQKLLINYMPQLEIIILGALQSLYTLLIKPLTSSSIKSPITRIRYRILVRRSIIIRICLYALPWRWYTSSVVIQSIEISVYRRAGSSSSFRKPSGVEQGVLVRKHRVQFLTKVAVNQEIPGYQYIRFKRLRVLIQPG